MKKKFIAIIFSFLLMLSLTACEEPVQVNVSNSENVSSNQFGTYIKIGNNLFYDPATRIVYFKSTSALDCPLTPYYAPNGLPYRYNPETNTFEEINILFEGDS